MRAVVTGGAGFIGSHLVDALMEYEAEVLVLDDLSSGNPANLRDALSRTAQFLDIDVRDSKRVTAEFIRFRPELVFHLAAQIDVQASMEEPVHDSAINVGGSIAVFAAADAAGARRIVNASSGGAIYGEAAVVPTPEAEPAAPVSAYGLSKHAAEQYARWFRHHRDMDIVTLRYSNVYGPRQSRGGSAGVVTAFCDTVLARGRATLYGDGTQTRDFVFVRDVVEANLAAAWASAPLPHDVYNIGSGQEVNVLDLGVAVAQAAHEKPSAFAPVHLPARAGEVRRSCLDVSRAHRILGLRPPTPLVDGLVGTLNWLRNAGSL